MRETLVRRASRVLFKWMAYCAPAVPGPHPGGVLRDVTIVNPGRTRLGGHTCVVEGDRIARISPTQPEERTGPEGSDCAGGFVLPGLVDMHVHIPPPQRALANLLFLAHGVTTVRETGDADGTTWSGRRRIAQGKVPGPRIFASGPVLDGDPPFLFTSWVVRDAAEARDAVRTLVAKGADFIKIHHKLSAEALSGIRLAAEEAGLRVVGHIPISVPFAEARIWDVQHLDGLVPYPQPPKSVMDYQVEWRDLDAARIEAYVRTSVEQGMVHTPTLVTSYRYARLDDHDGRTDPVGKLLPRYYRDVVWNRQNGLFRAFSGEALEVMKQGFVRGQEVVRRLHEAGVRIHLGTDTAAAPFVVPGVSAQEELGHLMGAGLTAELAWAAATRGAGESLGVPLLGTVQEGAPADLLIFDRDPTRHLGALSSLRGVVAQGRLYTKSALQEGLARHRQRFERPLYDAMSTALIRQALKRMAST